MTANESLRDSFISHAVYFERYKTHEVNQLFKVIDEVNRAAKAEIQKTDGAATKARYQTIMKEIASISAEARESIDGQLRLDIVDLIENESGFVQKAVNASIGVDLELIMPAPKQVFTAATFMPFSASSTFETMLNDLDKNLYSQWDMSVRAGYLAGETAQVINRRVLGSVSGLQVGTMEKLKRDLEANTRTMIAHYADQTRKAVYRENEDIFQGYQRLETLDTKTCLVCGAIDGKIYKRLEDDPGVIHLRCRGLAVPILKGWEGLGITERASVDGVVPGSTNYEEWLRKQSVDRQKDILGPSRYELFKNGAPLKGFTVDGKTMSLSKWKQVEGNTEKYGTPNLAGGGIKKSDQTRRDAHANTFYEEIRNRKSATDVVKVSMNTGFSENEIKNIRNHIFTDIHDFDEGVKSRFAPDFEISQAWQRMEAGKAADSDLVLLRHELKELTLMRENGYTYEKAHEIAHKDFPWAELIKGDE